MKKRMVMILVTLCLIISCMGCNSSYETDTVKENLVELEPINKIDVAQAIEQSSMSDNGYRFANKEFENQFSVYATYYIRKAKEDSGVEQVLLQEEAKDRIIEKFLINTDLDLTDVFCAISLLEGDDKITNEIKIIFLLIMNHFMMKN